MQSALKLLSFQFYLSSIKRRLTIEIGAQEEAFQFYLSSIKSSRNITTRIIGTTFQFYLSSIKRIFIGCTFLRKI